MPELPDIVVYIEALEKRIQGSTLERVRVASPFLLRTAVPPLSSVEGKKIVELRRLGKRICFGLEADLWLVLHLMIAGRLHWYDERAKAAKGRSVAVFEFSTGSLTLTEAGTQKRASLHVLQGEAGLESLNPGGLEVFDATIEEFARAIRAKNHTLKRALTDPRILSGIGNAYSDEILFDARLSPFTLTQKLSDEEVERLFAAIKRTLTEWLERLRAEAVKGFPEKVTAFRPDMATHGKYGHPCPRCGSKIQRIRYGSNETNYCPTCQTGGRLLADRALSRLLKDDWPRTPEELENLTKS
ncbi:MAG TPA: DNA-formamidopyrimidine glycosylase family protein [Pyrinomonadaceae bacterium]|nr:DNA-formamidopyrimidine glycosylase family protein [Pyrinomonadaceae bacterium]